MAAQLQHSRDTKRVTTRDTKRVTSRDTKRVTSRDTKRVKSRDTTRVSTRVVSDRILSGGVCGFLTISITWSFPAEKFVFQNGEAAN